MVVDRATATWREARFADLPDELRAGDVLVVNNSRVFPARLLGHREPSGGAVECLLLERRADGDWDALVHPGQKLKPGARMRFEDPARARGVSLVAEVLERQFFGRRRVRFVSVAGAADLDEAIDRLGHVPLPPYIHRGDTDEDRARYQTIFAASRGSIAAPTAGLHFDAGVIDRLRARGVDVVEITLHVGYGTFKPVRVDEVEDHQVDPERYTIGDRATETIARARAERRRIVAVGTTTTRALESAARDGGSPARGDGTAELFIYPGYQFRVVDALVTNFHLPRSSLLMLVAAFAGRDLVLAAYRDAIARGFQFYSYGDAMLIV
jgi:S-adenosylmethionine:tRNA ribosyltransferase-isomerase